MNFLDCSGGLSMGLLNLKVYSQKISKNEIELWSNDVIQQKINYIHNNPVEGGIVYRPEDYKYSSASDYAGEKGMLEGVCVFQYFKL